MLDEEWDPETAGGWEYIWKDSDGYWLLEDVESRELPKSTCKQGGDVGIPPITRLPPEIILLGLEKLSAKGAVSAMTTCKKWYNLKYVVWRFLFKRDCPKSRCVRWWDSEDKDTRKEIFETPEMAYKRNKAIHTVGPIRWTDEDCWNYMIPCPKCGEPPEDDDYSTEENVYLGLCYKCSLYFVVCLNCSKLPPVGTFVKDKVFSPRTTTITEAFSRVCEDPDPGPPAAKDPAPQDLKNGYFTGPLCKLMVTPLDWIHPCELAKIRRENVIRKHFHRGRREILTLEDLQNGKNWDIDVQGEFGPCEKHEIISCSKCAWILSDHNDTSDCECDDDQMYTPVCPYTYEDAFDRFKGCEFSVENANSMEMISISFEVTGSDGGQYSIWICPICLKEKGVTDK